MPSYFAVWSCAKVMPPASLIAARRSVLTASKPPADAPIATTAEPENPDGTIGSALLTGFGVLPMRSAAVFGFAVTVFLVRACPFDPRRFTVFLARKAALLVLATCAFD